MSQDSLFGTDVGRDLKKRGMEQVAGRAGGFLAWARNEAKRISYEKGQVSINDLRPLAAKLGLSPHHSNAWGTVFSETGWTPVGDTHTKLPASHARRVRVWRWSQP